ncbi:MAG TPA: glycoside hydrolase family 75 protein [Pyrinomonadaceae bacterium]|nr:glycoside hydrolase family 75 protein [Pyrinomonadaceae bacterium]
MSCDKVKVSDVCKEFNHQTGTCAHTTPVWQLPGKRGYFFVAKMAIDVDGAPRAYHPEDKRPPDNHTKALDWLANLSTSDRHGIQGKDGAVGPEPGFIISGTALGNPAFTESDTRHWVDAEHIPYVVLVSRFPRNPSLPRVKLGDCAMVIDLSSGKSTSAIFADVGAAVGEASMKTALNLGLDPTQSHFSPKVRGFDQDFLYIVFPDSKISPPWNTDEIETLARDRFQQWGGMDQVRNCFPTQ